jgi:hypothetical protein
MRTFSVVAVLCALAVGGLYASGVIFSEDVRDPAFADARTLDWIDLIPAQEATTAARMNDGTLPRGVVEHGQMGRGDVPDLTAKLGGFGNLDGPPRRMSDAFGGIGNLRALQPRGGTLRDDLDGTVVRIPGFVTPLAFEGSRVSQFLLVPYVGACIHVPPPPANQIVFVAGFSGYKPEGMLYPVWVTGRLSAVPLETELASVGYQIKDAWIERYAPD